MINILTSHKVNVHTLKKLTKLLIKFHQICPLTAQLINYHNLFISAIGSSCSVNTDCDAYITDSECDTNASPSQCICSPGFEANAENSACSAISMCLKLTILMFFSKNCISHCLMTLKFPNGRFVMLRFKYNQHFNYT